MFENYEILNEKKIEAILQVIRYHGYNFYYYSSKFCYLEAKFFDNVTQKKTDLVQAGFSKNLPIYFCLASKKIYKSS